LSKTPPSRNCHRLCGGESQLTAGRIDHERQLHGGLSDDGHGLAVVRQSGLRDQLGQLRYARAITSKLREDMRAQIKIFGDVQATPDDLIQGSPYCPAVTHAGEQVQSAACNPIGRTSSLNNSPQPPQRAMLPLRSP